MNEALIEKVRKLLAKTEGAGCSQAEAESAFKLASRLMAEHNLSMADVEVSGSDDEWADELGFETSVWRLEYTLAYGIVKNFFFVECYFSEHRRGKSKLMFFGKPENVAVAKFTFTALLNAFGRLWSEYRIIHKRPVTERKLFITGVAGGFKQKLTDEREAEAMRRDIMQGKTGGTAIALANINEITLAKYKEAHPGGKASRSNYSEPTGDQSTLKAGFEAGRNLNLNHAIGGASRRSIGG